MATRSLNLHNFIEVSAGAPSAKHWKLELEPGLKAVAAIASLALDPTGVPPAIGHLAGALKKIVHKLEEKKTPSAEGFGLYVFSLTLAIRRTPEEEAPSFTFNSDTNTEISSVIISSLSKEPIYLSKRFFKQPALNPGFIRVKENFLSLLSKVDGDVISADQIDIIGNKLGRSFSKSIFEVCSLQKQKTILVSF